MMAKYSREQKMYFKAFNVMFPWKEKQISDRLETPIVGTINTTFLGRTSSIFGVNRLNYAT
jgi:hypothetical protein